MVVGCRAVAMATVVYGSAAPADELERSKVGDEESNEGATTINVY